MRPDYYKAIVKASVDGERRSVTLECFDLIDALGGGFYFGNALKYLFRAGRKGSNPDGDLEKVVTYCNVLRARIRADSEASA